MRTVVTELAEIISATRDPGETMSATERRTRRFLKQLAQRPDGQWSLDSMAEACGVKRTQFAKLTARITGYPPLKYLALVRIERARELLRLKTTPITDIAFECGYGSSQYFAETFKRHMGMTPSTYRDSLPATEATMRQGWLHPEWRSIDDEHERAAMIQ